MKKYLIDFVRNDTATAGSKAESDISAILKTDGFLSIYYDVELPRAVKYLFEDYIIAKKVSGISNEDLCVFQYSLYSRGSLIKFVKKLSGVSRKILYIHDIASLRELDSDVNAIKHEISIFNLFNCLIVHNDSMKEWLKKNGVNVPMVSLEIFDYLHTIKINRENIHDFRTIVFAGNLDKSQFLEKLDIQTSISLFGMKTKEVAYKENINYLGSKTSTEIPSAISAFGFGLVWDGGDTDSCTGMFGEYMKYNNPHKVSLYLSSGLPVIIWDKAALASFITENHLGFAVSSLDEIDALLESITVEEYIGIQKNVNIYAQRLREGFFTKQSYIKSLKLFL
ncbi:sugar transferase [Streptococcus suis]|nr:sugar transferase [Streptococcus suis]NQJ77409.1 sugar transferase [Streptococcus suis]